MQSIKSGGGKCQVQLKNGQIRLKEGTERLLVIYRNNLCLLRPFKYKLIKLNKIIEEKKEILKKENMSCSIHLGNYILVVEPNSRATTPKTEGIPGGGINGQNNQQNKADANRGRSPTPTKQNQQQQSSKSVTINTGEILQQDMGALDFELAWLRFLRDAEEDYQKRQCRNAHIQSEFSHQPLSIFDVNTDVFECYLLRVSGRALASTQHLNLSITSAMASHLKIFDTQTPEAPSEWEQDMEQEDQMNMRRQKREQRRRKLRRTTAEFQSKQHAHQYEEQVPIQQQEPPKKAKNLLDSLNERDGGSSEEGQAPMMRTIGEDESHEEFDVNDRSQTIEVPKNLLQIHQEIAQQQQFAATNEPYMASMIQQQIQEDQEQIQQQHNSSHYVDSSLIPPPDAAPMGLKSAQTLKDFRSSQLYPDSIIQTEEDPNNPGHHMHGDENHLNQQNEGAHGKIMIGDQSIDENFGEDHMMVTIGADGQPIVHHYHEDDDIINEDEIEGGNPFRRKSVSFIKEQSIVSQGSIPNVGDHTFNGSQSFIPGGLAITMESQQQLNLTGGDGLQQQVLSEQHKENTTAHDSLEEKKSPSVLQIEPAQEQAKVEHVVQEVDISSPPQNESGTAPVEEPPLVISKNDEPTAALLSKAVTAAPDHTPVAKEENDNEIVESPFRPTTATGAVVPQLIVEAVQTSPIPEERKPQLVEVALQSSFKEEERPQSPPEAEIIMRFEVAVGTTPPQLSFAEEQKPHEESAILPNNHVDAAIGGNTPLNLTLDGAAKTSDRQVLQQQMEVSVGVGSNIVVNEEGELTESRVHEETTHIHNQSIERDPSVVNHSVEYNNDAQQHSKVASRLEVTLTAEPDKPIMVEVRGGEKQFLISALTKHIYEILSQPHKLQISAAQEQQQHQQQQLLQQQQQQEIMQRDEAEHMEYGEEEEEEAELVDEMGNQYYMGANSKQIHIGKNINLKLKSLKRNINSNNSRSSKHQLSSSKHAITIDELEMSSKLDEEGPSISHHGPKSPIPDMRTSPIYHPESAQKQAPVGNVHPWIGKSSRSSSGIALSPLTASIVAGGEEQNKKSTMQQKQPRNGLPHGQKNHRRTERDLRYDQISKRTTEEAFDDAKIREEVRVTGIFESETANSIAAAARRETGFSGPNDLSNAKKTNSQRRENNEQRTSLIAQKKLSQMSQAATPVPDEVLAQQLARSRPETATFNQDPPMLPPPVPPSSELPPINMKSSQLSNRLLEIQSQPRTPKYQQPIGLHSAASASNFDEEIIYTEKPRRSRRAQSSEDHMGTNSTIEDHSALNQDFVNSTTPAPAEPEQFSLPPLQPTIPMPHPNGYFVTASDTDINGSIGNGGNYLVINHADTAGQNYILDQNGVPIAVSDLPQVNYYDPYITPGQPQMIDGTYYQYASVPDDDFQGGGSQDEYILAEGYLLRYDEQVAAAAMEESVNQDIDLQRQVYDLSRNQPPTAVTVQPNNRNSVMAQTATAGFNPQSRTGFNRQHTFQNHQLQQAEESNTQQSRNGYPPYYPNAKKGGTSKLPVVPAKKRMLANSQNNTIYGLNGGPAFKTIQYTPAKSLSPLRRKNHAVYFTSNYSSHQPHQPAMVAAAGVAPQYEEPHYYSQSPQPSRLQRHSPYLSDDEFKILHDFYDIQCEPTGLNRGGVPLMRVKRINRPKATNPHQRTYNIFNFTDESGVLGQQQNGQNVSSSMMPKTISSLQIFYPQYQPNSQLKQELLMSRTLATPSKWFDRFYQSTRNLNQTIQNMHKQHNRKLRSYSVTSLSSGGAAGAPGESVVASVTAGIVQGPVQGGVSRINSREIAQQQQPLFTKHHIMAQSRQGANDIDIGLAPQREHVSLPSESDANFQMLQQQQQPLMMTPQEISAYQRSLKKASASMKGSAAVFMPPLQRAANNDYNNAGGAGNMGAPQKKNKLPPRPNQQQLAAQNSGNNGNMRASQNSLQKQTTGTFNDRSVSQVENSQSSIQESTLKKGGAAPGIVVTSVNAAT